MTTGVTWHCSHCDYGVPQAPNSAARALPEQCPNCKHVNVMWTTKEIARVSLFSRLHKLNKEATPGEWEAVDDGSRGARILTNAEGRLYVTPRHDEFLNPWLSNEDAALIVECRNSLPAVLNLIEAARQFIEDVDDALSDEPGGHDAYVRIGARFQKQHEKRLREAVAVFVTPEGDRSTMSGQEEPK